VTVRVDGNLSSRQQWDRIRVRTLGSGLRRNDGEKNGYRKPSVFSILNCPMDINYGNYSNVCAEHSRDPVMAF
jgi:hypothetical protein